MFYSAVLPQLPKQAGVSYPQHRPVLTQRVRQQQCCHQLQRGRSSPSEHRQGSNTWVRKAIITPVQDTCNSPARFWFQLRCPKKYISSTFYNTVFWRRDAECFYRTALRKQGLTFLLYFTFCGISQAQSLLKSCLSQK